MPGANPNSAYTISKRRMSKFRGGSARALIAKRAASDGSRSRRQLRASLVELLHFDAMRPDAQV